MKITFNFFFTCFNSTQNQLRDYFSDKTTIIIVTLYRNDSESIFTVLCTTAFMALPNNGTQNYHFIDISNFANGACLSTQTVEVLCALVAQVQLS